MLDNHRTAIAGSLALADDAPPPASGDERSRLTVADMALLYREERPRLIRYLRAYLRDPDDILDLVQETFSRLIRTAPALPSHAPAAYLRRTARNLLIDRWRRANSRPMLRSLDQERALGVPAEQSWRLEAEQARRGYEDALGRLPARTREIFLLHRVDKWPHRAIAAHFGISVAGVEYHMARALTQIARALDR